MLGALVALAARVLAAAQTCAGVALAKVAPDAAVPAPPAPPSVVPRVQEIYAAAARVVRGEISVLVVGEFGTGKELLARYVHAASASASGPFPGGELRLTAPRP